MFADFIQLLDKHGSLKGLIFENQEFYPDYQLEIYYDIRPQREQGTSSDTWRGITYSYSDYTLSNGDLDPDSLITDAWNSIEHYRKDPDRIGPIYITC